MKTAISSQTKTAISYLIVSLLCLIGLSGGAATITTNPPWAYPNAGVLGPNDIISFGQNNGTYTNLKTITGSQLGASLVNPKSLTNNDTRALTLPSLTATGTFTGNGAGLTNVNASSAASLVGNVEGYTQIYATNYGVIGTWWTNFFTNNVSQLNLNPQDTALAACIAAASALPHPCIVLPYGVIKLTNSVSIPFSNFKLVGGGVLHQPSWGTEYIGTPYTILWQSNTNYDCLHLDGTSMGWCDVENLELCGIPNPVTHETDYIKSPIWAQWGVTNAANPFAKVGLTIRDTNSFGPYCGGVGLRNVGLCGFKIGVVNGGNNEIWQSCQWSCCDLDLWNGNANQYSYIQGDYPDIPLMINAYGTLIDTNDVAGYHAQDGNGATLNLGVPDSVTINNPGFCSRKGGTAIFHAMGQGLTVNSSCDIYGPMCFAILGGNSEMLNVNGGADEPDGYGGDATYGGTNWIYATAVAPGVAACYGVIARDWKIRNFYYNPTNCYGGSVTNFSFFRGNGLVFNVSLDNVNIPNNPTFADTGCPDGLPFWFSTPCNYSGQAGYVINKHSDKPGVWMESGPNANGVYHAGMPDAFNGGFLQKQISSGYDVSALFHSYSPSVWDFTGKPLLMKNNSGPDFFWSVVNGNSSRSTNNFFITRFLQSDPQSLQSYVPNKVLTNNYTMNQLSLSTAWPPLVPASGGVLAASNSVLYWVTATSTNKIAGP